MTPDEMRHEIRRRAGFRGKRRTTAVHIVVTTSGRMLPPTMRTKKRNNHGGTEKEVVVSATWLQQKAPQLWAAFVAARLLNLPDRSVLTYPGDKKGRGNEVDLGCIAADDL